MMEINMNLLENNNLLLIMMFYLLLNNDLDFHLKIYLYLIVWTNSLAWVASNYKLNTFLQRFMIDQNSIRRQIRIWNSLYIRFHNMSAYFVKKINLINFPFSKFLLNALPGIRAQKFRTNEIENLKRWEYGGLHATGRLHMG